MITLHDHKESNLCHAIIDRDVYIELQSLIRLVQSDNITPNEIYLYIKNNIDYSDIVPSCKEFHTKSLFGDDIDNEIIEI